MNYFTRFSMFIHVRFHTACEPELNANIILISYQTKLVCAVGKKIHSLPLTKTDVGWRTWSGRGCPPCLWWSLRLQIRFYNPDVLFLSFCCSSQNVLSCLNKARRKIKGTHIWMTKSRHFYNQTAFVTNLL